MLYQSKSYTVLSIVIPIVTLIIGLNFPPYFVAGLMIVVEIVFSLLLSIEVKQLPVFDKGFDVKSATLPIA